MFGWILVHHELLCHFAAFYQQPDLQPDTYNHNKSRTYNYVLTQHKQYISLHNDPLNMYLVEKGDIKCTERLAKAQHLLLELMGIHLLNDSVFVVFLPDETHERGFLQRTQHSHYSSMSYINKFS